MKRIFWAAALMPITVATTLPLSQTRDQVQFYVSDEALSRVAQSAIISQNLQTNGIQASFSNTNSGIALTVNQAATAPPIVVTIPSTLPAPDVVPLTADPASDPLAQPRDIEVSSSQDSVNVSFRPSSVDAKAGNVDIVIPDFDASTDAVGVHFHDLKVHLTDIHVRCEKGAAAFVFSATPKVSNDVPSLQNIDTQWDVDPSKVSFTFKAQLTPEIQGLISDQKTIDHLNVVILNELNRNKTFYINEELMPALNQLGSGALNPLLQQRLNSALQAAAAKEADAQIKTAVRSVDTMNAGIAGMVAVDLGCAGTPQTEKPIKTYQDFAVRLCGTTLDDLLQLALAKQSFKTSIGTFSFQGHPRMKTQGPNFVLTFDAGLKLSKAAKKALEISGLAVETSDAFFPFGDPLIATAVKKGHPVFRPTLKVNLSVSGGKLSADLIDVPYVDMFWDSENGKKPVYFHTFDHTSLMYKIGEIKGWTEPVPPIDLKSLIKSKIPKGPNQAIESQLIDSVQNFTILPIDGCLQISADISTQSPPKK